jgi:hypothetical protein
MISTSFCLLHLALAAASPSGQVLPTSFEANRVYVTPQTKSGEQLKFFTDSGGVTILLEDTAKRLKLPSQAMPKEYGDDAKSARLPAFKSGLGIPAPLQLDGQLQLSDRSDTHFDIGDGMLGEAWFGGRIWTWNYPGKTLTLEGSAWKPSKDATRVPLGFPADDKGERAADFARITVRIDGKPIDLLLDTGATTVLTPEAMSAIHDTLPATRAASFIADNQFQAWHTAHPEWRVIENAQVGAKTPVSIIEVPQVEVGGARVGPVWFNWRSDRAFHDYMSKMMDKQVEGALGGNALGHFVMTVDYPGAAAHFACKLDCKAAAQSKR